MQVIYRPGGAAREYCELAANIYVGCTHGCKYCYVPKWQRKTREQYHALETPKKDFIKRFKADVKKLAAQGNEGPVHLTFAGDPFPPAEAEHGLTRQACEILVEHGLRVCILTKGRGDPAEAAMSVLTKDPRGPERHWWGATLTTINDDLVHQWEPGAAETWARRGLLGMATVNGLRTWVSLEPVIYPDETLEAIRQTHHFIDHYAVGKLNHFSLAEVRRWAPEAKPVDWPGFRVQVSGLLKDLGYRESDCNLPDGGGRSFYIKESLREAA